MVRKSILPGKRAATFPAYRYGLASRTVADYAVQSPASPWRPGRAAVRIRRVRKLLPDANGTAYDFYYNEAWQVLEVRKDPPSSANGGLRRAGANAAPYKQYVWDIRYVEQVGWGRWERMANHQSSTLRKETVRHAA